MAGSAARYHLDSRAEHLIAPRNKAGWKVDYIYSLYDGSIGHNATWQPRAAKFKPDPNLSDVQRQDLDATITQKIKTVGADITCSKVFNHYDTSGDDLSFIKQIRLPDCGVGPGVGQLLVAILSICTKKSTCCGNKLKRAKRI